MNLGIYFAILSMLAMGTFTVPMKSEAANSVDIDPFVFQTYKVIMCFFTSWLGLFWGIKFNFTWWGIVGASLWVPGATGGIFAVRNVGIALSVGIWASVTVLMSYIWGILIFNENVRSEWDIFLTMVLLAVGFVGMSYAISKTRTYKHSDNGSENGENDDISRTEPLIEVEFSFGSDNKDENLTKRSTSTTGDTEEYFLVDVNNHYDREEKPPIRVLGINVSRKVAGVCGAIMNGTLSGSSFIPIHYLREDEGGLSYIISFGIGAVIVTVFLWIVRYLLLVCKFKSCGKAYESLPSFHLKTMAISGCSAGFIWSIGNLGNTLAVTYLGNGIGLSLGQGALIISGLWGIFYYREVTDRRKIIVWFVSATTALYSIIKISQEHE